MGNGRMQRRVTVIDDSPELLALFGDLLRHRGVEITLFEASATLLEIEESAPDLLVIDLRLGSESLAGMEIIRLVRAHREMKEVPIIVCSAALDELARLNGSLSQIPDLFVLPKPFSLDELEACVTDALGEQFAAATG